MERVNRKNLVFLVHFAYPVVDIFHLIFVFILFNLAIDLCDQNNNPCSPNAECSFNKIKMSVTCNCKSNYEGDGYYCRGAFVNIIVKNRAETCIQDACKLLFSFCQKYYIITTVKHAI